MGLNPRRINIVAGTSKAHPAWSVRGPLPRDRYRRDVLDVHMLDVKLVCG